MWGEIMLLKKLLKDTPFLISSGIFVVGIFILGIKNLQPLDKNSPLRNNTNQITLNNNSPDVKIPDVKVPDVKIPSISVTGAGVQNILKQKNPEFWLVDKNGSSQSDSNNFIEVYLNAKNGDTIKIKEGVYQLPQKLERKSLTIIGVEEDSKKVILTNPNGKTVIFNSPKINIQNLTILDSGSTYKFLEFERGDIFLSNILISSENNTTLLKIRNGVKADISQSILSTNQLGDAINCIQCKLTIADSKIINNDKGIKISDKSEINMDSVQLINNKIGLTISNYSTASINNSKFIDNQDLGLFVVSGLANLKSVVISNSRTGISLRPNTKLVINDSQIIDHGQYGIFASASSRVESKNGLQILNGNYPFSVSGNGYINLGKCQITGNIKQGYVATNSIMISEECINVDTPVRKSRLPANNF